MRLVLAAVWLGAGAAQLAGLRLPHALSAIGPIAMHPSRRAPVLDALGALVPWFELALGALLLLGIGIRVTAALAMALALLLLTGATASPLSGLDLPIGRSCLWDRTCPVVTSGPDRSDPEIVVGGVGVAVLCLWLVVRPHCALAMDTLLAKPTGTNRRRRPAHAAVTTSRRGR